MQLTGRFLLLVLTLLSLTLLAAACSSVSPTLLPQPVKPPAILALPPQARQPVTPQDCLPTCSAGLTRLRATWLALPMNAEQPVAPASQPTTR